MKEYVYTRHQHAVGHGFFHSARISNIHNKAQEPFVYVYDCGSKRYRTLLQPEVESLIKQSKSIDMLILSHLHSDHINGLKWLLPEEKNARSPRVKLAFIPYLHPSEKLMLATDLIQRRSIDDAEIRLVLNPESELRRRGVETVVVVEGGNDPVPSDPAPSSAPPPASDQSSRWRIQEEGATASTFSHGQKLNHDKNIIASSGTNYLLEFRFFVHKMKVNELVKDLKDIVGTSLEEIEKNECSLPSVLAEKSSREKLIKCYSKHCSGKLNWTTLCMYVGLKPQTYHHFMSNCTFENNQTTVFQKVVLLTPESRETSNAASWLGTGDLELKDGHVAEAFFKHYERYQTIDCISLPHHGSKENFDIRLLAQFHPKFVFATCPEDSKHHPAQDVVRQVRETSTFLPINAQSRLLERFDIECLER